MHNELKPDTQLSHYRIVSKIGAGGMGEVYLAEDTTLDRQVALKVLLAEVAGDDERVKRFIREAKAASALNHPNILTVFEIGSFDGSQYIATELIKGETLRDRMGSASISLDAALGIALNVAAALGAAHEAGIIHRDIKPENIMIRDDGLVKILDFGLAKLTEKRAETAEPEDATKAQFNTQPGLVMGTVAYMSPEQARGHKLDARSDIFSFGIVLYELFTGKSPFTGEGHLDLISSILKDEPSALRQLSPNLPRQLERIVDKTLRKERGHRYQHVKDLEIDLGDLREELKFESKLNKTSGQTIPAQTTSVDAPRPTLTQSISATRRFTLLHAILFVVAALSLIGGVWYLRGELSRSATLTGTFKTTEVANWGSAAGELFSNARFSPDGKMIAFASTKSGNKNIWVTQTGSTEAIQVTNDAFSNTDPIWSPEGNEVAYFSQKGNSADGKSSSTGVWRASALGGGVPRSVGPISDGSATLRRWTAGGKIYYQSNNDLYAMDISSGSSAKVTSLNGKSGSVPWISISADEKSISYVVKTEGAWQLLVRDLASSSPTQIAEGDGEINGAVWLGDQNRFFFSSMVDGVFQVFAANPGSGQPAKLTSGETDSIVVDASPDGRAVIFSSAKEESNLWRVNLSGDDESPVARDLNSKLWPSVSADNEKIAFQSVKNLSRGNNLFESAIVVKRVGSRAEGDNPTRLAERGFLPAWSPDGSSVAFLRRNNSEIELFSVNSNGGGEKRLASGAIPSIGYSVSPYNHVQTNAFSWSPDSARIAYVSERNGPANIWTVAPHDASDTSVTDNTDPDLSFYCPIWSSDGKRLAFFTQRKKADENGKTIRGIWLAETDTRKAAAVFESEKVIRLIGWTPDEKGMIIAETDKAYNALPPETVLKQVSAATGAETPIARIKNAYFYNIFLSGDRKYIGYAARNADKDDIWVITRAGGEARKLTNNNDSGLYFSRLAWLHDGSAIVFGKQTRFSLLSIITNIN